MPLPALAAAAPWVLSIVGSVLPQIIDAFRTSKTPEEVQAAVKPRYDELVQRMVGSGVHEDQAHKLAEELIAPELAKAAEGDPMNPLMAMGLSVLGGIGGFKGGKMLGARFGKKAPGMETGTASDIRHMGEHTDLSDVGKTSDIRGVGKTSNIIGMGRTTDIRGMGEKTDIKGMGKFTNLTNVGKTTDIRGMGKTSPVRNKAEKPVEAGPHAAPIEAPFPGEPRLALEAPIPAPRAKVTGKFPVREPQQKDEISELMDKLMKAGLTEEQAAQKIMDAAGA